MISKLITLLLKAFGLQKSKLIKTNPADVLGDMMGMNKESSVSPALKVLIILKNVFFNLLNYLKIGFKLSLIFAVAFGIIFLGKLLLDVFTVDYDIAFNFDGNKNHQMYELIKNKDVMKEDYYKYISDRSYWQTYRDEYDTESGSSTNSQYFNSLAKYNGFSNVELGWGQLDKRLIYHDANFKPLNKMKQASSTFHSIHDERKGTVNENFFRDDENKEENFLLSPSLLEMLNNSCFNKFNSNKVYQMHYPENFTRPVFHVYDYYKLRNTDFEPYWKKGDPYVYVTNRVTRSDILNPNNSFTKKDLGKIKTTPSNFFYEYLIIEKNFDHFYYDSGKRDIAFATPIKFGTDKDGKLIKLYYKTDPNSAYRIMNENTKPIFDGPYLSFEDCLNSKNKVTEGQVIDSVKNYDFDNKKYKFSFKDNKGPTRHYQVAPFFTEDGFLQARSLSLYNEKLFNVKTIKNEYRNSPHYMNDLKRFVFEHRDEIKEKVTSIGPDNARSFEQFLTNTSRYFDAMDKKINSYNDPENDEYSGLVYNGTLTEQGKVIALFEDYIIQNEKYGKKWHTVHDINYFYTSNNPSFIEFDRIRVEDYLAKDLHNNSIYNNRHLDALFPKVNGGNTGPQNRLSEYKPTEFKKVEAVLGSRYETYGVPDLKENGKDILFMRDKPFYTLDAYGNKRWGEVSLAKNPKVSEDKYEDNFVFHTFTGKQIDDINEAKHKDFNHKNYENVFNTKTREVLNIDTLEPLDLELESLRDYGLGSILSYVKQAKVTFSQGVYYKDRYDEFLIRAFYRNIKNDAFKKLVDEESFVKGYYPKELLTLDIDLKKNTDGDSLDDFIHQPERIDMVKSLHSKVEEEIFTNKNPKTKLSKASLFVDTLNEKVRTGVVTKKRNLDTLKLEEDFVVIKNYRESDGEFYASVDGFEYGFFTPTLNKGFLNSVRDGFNSLFGSNDTSVSDQFANPIKYYRNWLKPENTIYDDVSSLFTVGNALINPNLNHIKNVSVENCSNDDSFLNEIKNMPKSSSFDMIDKQNTKYINLIDEATTFLGNFKYTYEEDVQNVGSIDNSKLASGFVRTNRYIDVRIRPVINFYIIGEVYVDTKDGGYTRKWVENRPFKLDISSFNKIDKNRTYRIYSDDLAEIKHSNDGEKLSGTYKRERYFKRDGDDYEWVEKEDPVYDAFLNRIIGRNVYGIKPGSDFKDNKVFLLNNFSISDINYNAFKREEERLEKIIEKRNDREMEKSEKSDTYNPKTYSLEFEEDFEIQVIEDNIAGEAVPMYTHFIGSKKEIKPSLRQELFDGMEIESFREKIEIVNSKELEEYTNERVEQVIFDYMASTGITLPEWINSSSDIPKEGKLREAFEVAKKFVMQSRKEEIEYIRREIPRIKAEKIDLRKEKLSYLQDYLMYFEAVVPFNVASNSDFEFIASDLQSKTIVNKSRTPKYTYEISGLIQQTISDNINFFKKHESKLGIADLEDDIKVAALSLYIHGLMEEAIEKGELLNKYHASLVGKINKSKIFSEKLTRDALKFDTNVGYPLANLPAFSQYQYQNKGIPEYTSDDLRIVIKNVLDQFLISLDRQPTLESSLLDYFYGEEYANVIYKNTINTKESKAVNPNHGTITNPTKEDIGIAVLKLDNVHKLPGNFGSNDYENFLLKTVTNEEIEYVISFQVDSVKQLIGKRDNRFSVTGIDSDMIGKNKAQTISNVYGNNEIMRAVSKYSEEFGVDEALVCALISLESGGNKNAGSFDAGLGLMQIQNVGGSSRGVTCKDKNGNLVSFSIQNSERTDIEKSVKWGVMYLKSMIDKADGDILLGLTGYNVPAVIDKVKSGSYGENWYNVYNTTDGYTEIGLKSSSGVYYENAAAIMGEYLKRFPEGTKLTPEIYSNSPALFGSPFYAEYVLSRLDPDKTNLDLANLSTFKTADHSWFEKKLKQSNFSLINGGVSNAKTLKLRSDEVYQLINNVYVDRNKLPESLIIRKEIERKVKIDSLDDKLVEGVLNEKGNILKGGVLGHFDSSGNFRTGENENDKGYYDQDGDFFEFNNETFIAENYSSNAEMAIKREFYTYDLFSILGNKINEGSTNVFTEGVGLKLLKEIGIAGKWQTPMKNPTYTSPWGYRNMGKVPWHCGADVVSKEGNHGPVYSVGDGIVITADYTNSAYGNYVEIAHPHGTQSKPAKLVENKFKNVKGYIVTRYFHFSSIEPGLKAGDIVKAGQKIGNQGTSGNSTGFHLHFEVAPYLLSKGRTFSISNDKETLKKIGPLAAGYVFGYLTIDSGPILYPEGTHRENSVLVKMAEKHKNITKVSTVKEFFDRYDTNGTNSTLK